MLSCNSNIVRITQIPKEPPISENKNVKILLHLYDEPDAVKEIEIKSAKGELLYTSQKGLGFNKTTFVEINVLYNTKYLIIRYNKGKNKILVRSNYKYLYIDRKSVV